MNQRAQKSSAKSPPLGPLYPYHILTTRARTQSSPFSKLLRSYGAKVTECPTIRIMPPKSFKSLDQAIRVLPSYDWVIFTSVNGVKKFMERARKILKGFKFPSLIQTCAIGPLTADSMKHFKIPVTKISKEYVAESILKFLYRVKGKKILIPRARVARDVLPKTLKKRGAKVHVVEAYQTKIDRSKTKTLKNLIRKEKINCITFTSSSTVKNFFSLLSLQDKKQLLKNGSIQAASIGPVTSATLDQYQWPPKIIAAKPTTQHLARAILRFYQKI